MRRLLLASWPAPPRCTRRPRWRKACRWPSAARARSRRTRSLATSIRTTKVSCTRRQGAHPQPAEPGGVEPVVPSRGRPAAAGHWLRGLGLSLLPQAQPRLLRDHGRQARAVAREARPVGCRRRAESGLAQSVIRAAPVSCAALTAASRGKEGGGGPGACGRPPGRAVLPGGAPATAGQDTCAPSPRRSERDVKDARFVHHHPRDAARRAPPAARSGSGRDREAGLEALHLCQPDEVGEAVEGERAVVVPACRSRRSCASDCWTAAVAASRAVSGQRTRRKPSSRRCASSSSGVRPPSTASNSSGVSGNASRHRHDLGLAPRAPRRTGRRRRRRGSGERAQARRRDPRRRARRSAR